jgi:hypothetical protein
MGHPVGNAGGLVECQCSLEFGAANFGLLIDIPSLVVSTAFARVGIRCAMAAIGIRILVVEP